ncbi:hypothetical protein HB779_18640 [Phyllobacterium sp. 628]|uniref:lipid-A-disaccharide synthase N-terminal domain-containing protein n=1 Tax=Phyllobacterium sp. 628 TaxID=2718938 RepID=UPI00166227C9|nr:lipid-A-disaccharide synthase N-terminal domain-containing protein [Phyllobacterium sp. 628]QND53680.1 hypothetical protein HB779_18640 [Phyllobacterium sp. 628]
MADAITNWLHSVFIAQLDAWMIFGLIGQACFTMRFFVQWLASEKVKRSVVPVAFWVFSLFGGVLLLVYSVVRRDPVYIVGQALGLFVYIRNLWLIVNEKWTKTDLNIIPATTETIHG